MDEFVGDLKSLSDDEKIDRLRYESNYYYIHIMVMSLQSDELKLQMIDKLQDYDKVKLVESLQSDDLKLDYIRSMKQDDYKKKDIAKSIKSDELKIEALSLFDDNDDINKGAIIVTLQSDEKKIEAMKQHIKPCYYREIIARLSSWENKIANLNLLNYSYDKQIVLESIEIVDDEQRLSIVASFAGDDDIVSRVIEDIKDERIKIKALDYLVSDYYKAEIICTIQDDATKKEQLEKLSQEPAKVGVIKKLQDDASKIEELDKLSGEPAKAEVIMSLNDDKTKIEQLELLSDESLKADVICTIQDDATKKEQLEKLSKEPAKAKVIMSLNDDKTMIEQLELLSDESLKADVICTIQDDATKKEQLEKLSEEPAKVRVIIELQDDASKIDELGKLRDDFAKAKVIKTLQDDNSKIEQLEKINSDFAKTAVIITLQDDTNIIEQFEKLHNDLAKVLVIKTLQEDNRIISEIPEEPLIELLIDRSKLKEFLKAENNTYTEIGLDKNITIGMEIESEGTLSELIENFGKIINKQNGVERNGWETKGDGSLEEGVEVVSPILTDNKEDVEDIYMVCSMMQKCGQSISENCGGHIHIGADYLTSKEAYVNLFEIWGNAEKIICKMSNEIGTIPRMGLQEYASPISQKLNEAIESETVNLESEEDLEQFISKVQEVQGDRYSGLNLLNINNGKNTIEFRIPNGTINPDTWIENARLFGRIVQISQRLAEIEKQPEQSKEEKRKLELMEIVKDEIPEQEKMEVLLELLFTEEERQVYRDRYISSSKLLEQIPDEKNPFQETKFSRVDFKKKKHNMEEFYDVAVNDRSESMNDVTRETTRGIRTENEIEHTGKNLEGK